MKRKSLLKSIMFFIVLLIGVVNVNAEEVEINNFEKYNKGDLIKVKVNDITTVDFYVLTDNDNKVSAMSKDAVFNDLTLAEAWEKIYDIKVNEWTNVKMIRLPEMTRIFGENVDLTKSFKFTNPSYAISETNYWVNGTVSDSTNGWQIGKTLDGEGVAGEFDASMKADVRPLIIIQKSFVEKVEETVYDSVWKEFIEKYKKTEYISTLTDTASLSFVTGAKSLKVIGVDKESNKSFSAEFVYEDGILIYVPSAIKLLDYSNQSTLIENSESILYEDFMILNAIKAISDLKGYDYELVEELILENSKLSLLNDGIEVEYITYSGKESDKNGSTSYSWEMVKSFKLDIKNGFKLFNKVTETPKQEVEEPVEEKIENPKTGDTRNIVNIALIIVVSLTIIIYIKCKKYDKFLQI